MRVNEIFSSIQGEGINIGKFATFIRFAGCNMDPKCSWCDTKYAWSEGTEMTIDNIREEVKKFRNTFVVFTGGEPLIQLKVARLAQMLHHDDYDIAVETNGLILDTTFPGETHFTVSPKIGFKVDPVILDLYNNRREGYSVEFKFVIGNAEDIRLAKALIDQLELAPTVFQPLNGDLNTMKFIIDTLQTMGIHNIRVLPQLHKLLKVR